MLRGLAGVDDLFGLGGKDLLAGGAGDDRLYGGTESDVLTGGIGADLLDGGTGSDMADYSAAAAGVVLALPRQPGTGGGTVGEALGDQFIGIENVTGSAFDGFHLAATMAPTCCSDLTGWTTFTVTMAATRSRRFGRGHTLWQPRARFALRRCRRRYAPCLQRRATGRRGRGRSRWRARRRPPAWWERRSLRRRRQFQSAPRDRPRDRDAGARRDRLFSRTRQSASDLGRIGRDVILRHREGHPEI